MEHKRPGKNDACNSTQHRYEPLSQITATYRNEYRNDSKYPERNRKMRANIAWRYETRHACQYDIVGFQIRIELRMPDARGKDKQNKP